MSEDDRKNDKHGKLLKGARVALQRRTFKDYPQYADDEVEAVVVPVDEDMPVDSDDNSLQDASATETDISADESANSEGEASDISELLPMVLSALSLAVSYIGKFVFYVGELTLWFFLICRDRFTTAIQKPLMFTLDKLKMGSRLVFIKLARLPKTTWKDYVEFRSEATFVKIKARQMKSKRRFAVQKALWRYYTRSFRRYGRFWKTVFNTVFPVVALLILITTVNSRQNTTYALEVTYNGNTMGYVENEQIYNDARNSAIAMLSVGGTADSSQFNNAVYSITRVPLNKLSDASVISERLIESTDVGYVQACGIYIDGEFLCAVKNEADAATVFDNILTPYQEKAGKNDIVAFVEEIEYRQGLYADTSGVMWDAVKLKSTVEAAKKSAVYYKVQVGDTISAIASRYNLTTRELMNLNSGVSEDDIYVGDTLLVSQQVNFVRVKVMKTETRTESVSYDTVRKDSSTLYKGTTKTVQNGSDGKNQITELVTYIDGIKTYASHISTKVLYNPVDKIIYVGTKAVETPSYSSSYSSDSSSGSSGSASSTVYTPSTSSGLSWPTVSAYHISSYFGYRTLNGRYKFHRGVDIVRSGGGSAGLSVIAAASGTVVEAGYSGSYGNMVLIDHGNGIKTRYAHMQSGSLSVSYGSHVVRGQQIGRIGSTGNSTGPHLHFEVIVNGSNVNPLSYVG